MCDFTFVINLDFVLFCGIKFQEANSNAYDYSLWGPTAWAQIPAWPFFNYANLTSLSLSSLIYLRKVTVPTA